MKRKLFILLLLFLPCFLSAKELPLHQQLEEQIKRLETLEPNLKQKEVKLNVAEMNLKVLTTQLEDMKKNYLSTSKQLMTVEANLEQLQTDLTMTQMNCQTLSKTLKDSQVELRIWKTSCIIGIPVAIVSTVFIMKKIEGINK